MERISSVNLLQVDLVSSRPRSPILSQLAPCGSRQLRPAIADSESVGLVSPSLRSTILNQFPSNLVDLISSGPRSPILSQVAPGASDSRQPRPGIEFRSSNAGERWKEQESLKACFGGLDSIG